MELTEVNLDLADIKCPHCNTGYDVFFENPGDRTEKTKCPKCKKDITIMQLVYFEYKCE